MSFPDLSKLILYGGANSFKNINSYVGSITLPASIPPDSITPTETTTVIQLEDTPVFTQFFAQFNDLYSGISQINDVQWYNASGSGLANVSYPAVYSGSGNLPIACSIYPIIDGNTVTITARGFNQTASTYTANITIPFVFVEYTLAN